MARLIFWLILLEALVGLAVSDAFASPSSAFRGNPPLATSAVCVHPAR